MSVVIGRPLIFRKAPSTGADLCTFFFFLFFFAGIGHLTLCGRLRQKGCTKSCELTLKSTFFSASEGAHPPQHAQTPPVPTSPDVLFILSLGVLFKNPGSTSD